MEAKQLGTCSNKPQSQDWPDAVSAQERVPEQWLQQNELNRHSHPRRLSVVSRL
jgi:hypothetical protein